MKSEKNCRVGLRLSRKNFLVLFLLINLLCLPVCAFEFDTSVDDDIRRNYDPSKLENDMALPALPKVLNEPKTKVISISQSKTANLTKKEVKPQTLQYKQTTQRYNNESYATLNQGTKINIKLINPISDRAKKGTKVTFISQYPVSTTYFTIPMGTTFYGEITDVHKPQFTGNGGLIELKITSMVLNGKIHPLNAFVTEANYKNVYFNSIKGKRKYVKSVFKSMKPGCNFFKKMMYLSGRLIQDNSTIIVSPFSFTLGIVGLGGNVMISPVLGLFYKGDSMYIREGTNFEIELAQDVFIYN